MVISLMILASQGFVSKLQQAIGNLVCPFLKTVMKSAASQQATQRFLCRVQIQTSNCPAQEGLEFDALH